MAKAVPGPFIALLDVYIQKEIPHQGSRLPTQAPRKVNTETNRRREAQKPLRLKHKNSKENPWNKLFLWKESFTDQHSKKTYREIKRRVRVSTIRAWSGDISRTPAVIKMVIRKWHRRSLHESDSLDEWTNSLKAQTTTTYPLWHMEFE